MELLSMADIEEEPPPPCELCNGPNAWWHGGTFGRWACHACYVLIPMALKKRMAKHSERYRE